LARGARDARVRRCWTREHRTVRGRRKGDFLDNVSRSINEGIEDGRIAAGLEVLARAVALRRLDAHVASFDAHR
jgi:hypothetical protein